MSFGKRGANSGRAVNTPVAEPEESGWSRGDSGWLGEFVKLLMGIILAIGVFYAAIGSLRQYEKHRDDTFGDAPNEASLRRARNNSSVVAQDLYNKCPIPSTAGVQIGMQGSFRQQALQSLGGQLHKQIVFLDCLMRRERQRFCKKEARAELVDQLNGYIALKNEFIFFRDQMGPSQFDIVSEKLMNAQVEAGRVKYLVGPDVDNWVIEALNDLILAGYFLPDREYAGFFGPAIPGEFKGQLIDPIPGRDPCK